MGKRKESRTAAFKIFGPDRERKRGRNSSDNRGNVDL